MNVFEVGGKVDEMDEMERKVRREKERERKKEREKEEKKREREAQTERRKGKGTIKEQDRDRLYNRRTVLSTVEIYQVIYYGECVFVSEYVLHVEKRGKMRSV